MSATTFGFIFVELTTATQTLCTLNYFKSLVCGPPLSEQPVDYTDPDSEEREFVIAYASRGLTPAESHYAPTKGECLALVWATQKFRQYLHGQPNSGSPRGLTFLEVVECDCRAS